jgi:hypothetical protein
MERRNGSSATRLRSSNRLSLQVDRPAAILEVGPLGLIQHALQQGSGLAG